MNWRGFLIAAGAFWILCIAIGFRILAQEEFTPVKASPQVALFPRNSALPRVSDKPTLVLFAHPTVPANARDGWLEATRIIHSRTSRSERPYIVALTANAMKEDRDLCAAAGMDDYLSKPMRPAEIKAAIERSSARLSLQASCRRPLEACGHDLQRLQASGHSERAKGLGGRGEDALALLVTASWHWKTISNFPLEFL